MSPTPIETAPADTARAMHAAEMRGLDMQDAPERIWAWKWDFPYARKINGKCEWSSVAYPQEQAVTKYITEAECRRRVDAAVQAERDACEAEVRRQFRIWEDFGASGFDDLCMAIIPEAIRARGQK